MPPKLWPEALKWAILQKKMILRDTKKKKNGLDLLNFMFYVWVKKVNKNGFNKTFLQIVDGGSTLFLF